MKYSVHLIHMVGDIKIQNKSCPLWGSFNSHQYCFGAVVHFRQFSIQDSIILSVNVFRNMASSLWDSDLNLFQVNEH